MPWLMAGCVVPEPEKFREPKSTPPVFIVPQVAPPVNQIVRVTQGDALPFTIPYRSEDSAGDEPAAIMYRNFNTPEQQRLDGDTFEETSTFDDTERSFGITVRFDMTCGDDRPENAACCQQLTLLATHRSKLVLNDAGIPEVDPDVAGQDLAMLVWFAAVSPPGPHLDVVGKCPTPITPPVTDR